MGAVYPRVFVQSTALPPSYFVGGSAAEFDPVGTTRLFNAFKLFVVPDTIRVNPFIEKDPDGVMNGAKLALEITREAVVAKIPL